MSVWQYITSFGDSALLLPLITWMGLCLLAPLPLARWRDARRWAVAVVATGGTVCLTKLLFMAWGIGPPGLNYTGFSGHTALALLVWPSLGCMLTRGASLKLRRGAIAAGAIVGVSVAISRLVLKVHSPSEVWLGASLGVAVAIWFVRGHHIDRASPGPLERQRLVTLAFGAVVVWLICYGRVFPSQHVLQDIARWLSGHRGVFTRRIQLG